MALVEDAPYHDLCYKIIGAAMDIHNRLGPGHRERIYHRAMTQRLNALGLACDTEFCMEFRMEGGPIGRLYVDHLVENAVVVEYKALSHLLTNDEIGQVITYLAAICKPVGMLFNFGRRRLEYRRIFRPKTLEGWEDRIQRYLWYPGRDRRLSHEDVGRNRSIVKKTAEGDTCTG